MLKWAHDNGCDWDEYTCAYAAKNGHLEIIKWAVSNGCPWSSYIHHWDKNVCICAAYYGHIEVIKWGHENGCEWNEIICSNAAFNGARLNMQLCCIFNRRCE